MKRLVLSSLLAAVALFFWGFVFWGLLGVPSMIFAGVSDETRFAAEIKAQMPQPGIYILPGPATFADQQEFARRHEAGPVGLLFVQPQGLPVMPVGMMAGGLADNFVAILLMALMLRMAAPALPAYGQRVAVVVLGAASMIVLADLGDPIWWRHTWSFAAARAIYHTIGWAIVGLILARFIRITPAR